MNRHARHPRPSSPVSGQPRPGRRLSRRGKGFTLMEVLVALSVLSVALISIYQAFASTVQVNQTTRGLWKAIVFVNNELAKIERGPAPSVSVAQGVYQGDHPMAGYAWRREVADEEPFPGVKVRKVVLELTWDAAGAPQTYRADAYVQAK